ncbi:MAG: glycoside hydrolase family 127 protein [Lachnospiraceae bacterium]|nr:glycoside hydrolase family 127 protein [Lachnospiraceae bacterium]
MPSWRIMEKIMNVRITEDFWIKYRNLVRKEMIPYQWNVLNDIADINIERERDDDAIPNEKSHAIENFKIAAGLSEGEFYGYVFQDSDVYKWLEAASYVLREEDDAELRKKADEAVDLIVAAQQPDGYLDTYFIIKEPERKFMTLRESHELYCAGHFFEAACAYYTVTGNKKVLETAVKLADCIDAHFGPEEGKLHGADGHPEVEIGLMKLYAVTGEKRYLKLCEYFISIRGECHKFFAEQDKAEKGMEPIFEGMRHGLDTYFQIQEAPAKQSTAEGHAVRQIYLCTAMAELAREDGDKELADACRRIWRNIVDRRMYVTGGIGSTVNGEAFTLDYDLPNDTMYCETCASVGLIFFAENMLKLESKGEYADVMERALYNTVLSGMALDGRHFFYVNPLEVDPRQSRKNPTKSHVKAVRPEWLACACCPPNLARMIASVDDYIYMKKDKEIYVNLYIASEASFLVKNEKVKIKLETDYPKSGSVRLSIKKSGDSVIGFKLRIPGWAENVYGQIDGVQEKITEEKGYWQVDVVNEYTEINLNMPMYVERNYANTRVSADTGKVCISRGPLIYCAESVDNGEELQNIEMLEDAPFKESFEPKLLNGITVINTEGKRLEQKENSPLYSHKKAYEVKDQKIKLIPYYAWGNRGENEMRVWLHEK